MNISPRVIDHFSSENIYNELLPIMSNTLLTFLFVICSLLALAQTPEISCEDLMEYVENKGYNFDNVSSFQLINSSWLKEIKAYKLTIEYRQVIFVVARIKADEFGFSTRKYVFCGIPQSNWDSFAGMYSSLYSNSTYGERFHKYILDYRCNCY